MKFSISNKDRSIDPVYVPGEAAYLGMVTPGEHLTVQVFCDTSIPTDDGVFECHVSKDVLVSFEFTKNYAKCYVDSCTRPIIISRQRFNLERLLSLIVDKLALWNWDGVRLMDNIDEVDALDFFEDGTLEIYGTMVKDWEIF